MNLKFRAWDLKCKKWIDCNDYYINATTGKLCYLHWEWLDEYENEYLIMQSTGLKDKNDKEIYDGDIIECDIPLRNVFTPEHIGCVTIDLELSGGITIRNKKELVSDKNLVELLSKVQVIGNIYENPERL